MDPVYYNSSRRRFLKAGTFSSLSLTAIPTIASSYNSYYHAMKGENLTFLFQGDSITDGNRGRNEDPNHIMGHGYAFSIASRVGADFPDKALKFFNRGISGNTIVDLTNRWQQDTLGLKPDVLSILVGVNDTSLVVDGKSPATSEHYEEVYRSLVRETKGQNPDVLMVFCEPFILPVGRVKENWEVWHSDMVKKQKIVRRLANEEKGIFVGFQEVFDKAAKRTSPDYWIWDGIHPTVSGHELMTREWIKAVSERLPLLRKYSK